MISFSSITRLRYHCLLALALGGPLLAGCSSSSSDQLPTVAVRGTVTIDGKPSGRAMLQLTPTTAEKGRPGASGTVQDDGTYTLQTYAPGDGVPEGSYSVTLAPDYGKFMPVPPVKPLTVEITEANTDLEMKFQSAGQGSVGMPRPGMENVKPAG